MKCSEVMQYIAGLSNKVSNIIRRYTDNRKLLLLCNLLLLQSSLFPVFYFLAMAMCFIHVQYSNLCIFIFISVYSYLTSIRLHAPAVILRLHYLSFLRDF